MNGRLRLGLTGVPFGSKQHDCDPSGETATEHPVKRRRNNQCSLMVSEKDEGQRTSVIQPRGPGMECMERRERVRLWLYSSPAGVQSNPFRFALLRPRRTGEEGGPGM